MWFIDKRIQVICEELKRLAVVKKSCRPETCSTKKRAVFLSPGSRTGPGSLGGFYPRGYEMVRAGSALLVSDNVHCAGRIGRKDPASSCEDPD